MEPHSIVVVSLHTPKEKIWGELLSINTAGITLRGIDLNSFDHFIRQINEPDTERVGVPTLFFPMTRIERITLDEPSGSIPSMDELFNRKIGRRLIDAGTGAGVHDQADGTCAANTRESRRHSGSMRKSSCRKAAQCHPCG